MSQILPLETGSHVPNDLTTDSLAQVELNKIEAGHRSIFVAGWRPFIGWVVELTFGWMGRNRRLAKDFEKMVETSIAYLEVAMIQLMIRRLARS